MLLVEKNQIYICEMRDTVMKFTLFRVLREICILPRHVHKFVHVTAESHFFICREAENLSDIGRMLNMYDCSRNNGK